MIIQNTIRLNFQFRSLVKVWYFLIDNTFSTEYNFLTWISSKLVDTLDSLLIAIVIVLQNSLLKFILQNWGYTSVLWRGNSLSQSPIHHLFKYLHLFIHIFFRSPYFLYLFCFVPFFLKLGWHFKRNWFPNHSKHIRIDRTKMVSLTDSIANDFMKCWKTYELFLNDHY